MRTWRSYHVSVEIRAPLPFTFQWCTDYTSDDGRYGGEDKTLGLKRRIIEKKRRRVTFENLYDQGRGWAWERHVVTLIPPRRWHAEGVGNYQESVLDYELTAVAPDRTRFDMRWKSRPIGLSEGPRPRKSFIEAYVTGLWTERAKALEAEYRLSRARVKGRR